MLLVHRSNRVERLVEGLARVTSGGPGDPLEPEHVVVHGNGMERWLAMELARHHGVWANPGFHFPREFLRERVFGPLLDLEPGAADPWERGPLVWSIVDELPRHLDEAPFAAVARYLEGDSGGRRRVQLARRVAETFDDYATYRPDLVLGWEEGREPDDWQARLWRALVARIGGAHPARLSARAIEALAAGGPACAKLPSRVSLFGLTALPPRFVGVMRALATRTELHVFVPAPTAHPWGHVVDRREAARVAAASDVDASWLHLESGHPLLASLGRASRHFHAALLEADPELHDEIEDPASASDTLLCRLQSDIASLRDPTREPAPAADDGSISVHACHGPLREVEVLRDRILASLDEIPDLRPDQIAILTPDVETYAPLVEAVFRGGDPPLPVGVADRDPRRASPLAEAFGALLDVARGRLGAAEVMDLLAREAVRRSFDIEAADLDALRRWVGSAGIRWAADADDRAREGQPALEQNTWRWGLDRLLLGYALPRGETRPFGGVVAEPGVDGPAADLLGRLIEFCEALFELHERLERPASATARVDELRAALGRFVDPGDAGDELAALRDGLDRLERAALPSGSSEPLAFEALRPELERALGDRGRDATRALLSAGITMCELLPMRSIPFRVVALLGLGDEGFPRREVRPDFDRVARQPRPGDRSRRDEDRQLFLDALLATRERLIVTYPAFSPADGRERPPSVVVDELLDLLERGHGLAREQIVCGHPLHAFSPAAFHPGATPRERGFDVRARDAAAALLRPPAAEPPFAPGPVTIADDGSEAREIEIEELARFLRRPTRRFARALGLWLADDAGALEAREPVELDALARYRLGEEAIAGLTDPREAWRLRGELPPGRIGEQIAGSVLAVASAIREAAPALGSTPLLVDREVGGYRLRGSIGGWVGADARQRVELTYRREGSSGQLACWVRHVVACWITGVELETTLVERDAADAAITRFEPVDDAGGLVALWIDWWRRARSEPLPLFSETSRDFAERSRGGAARADALRAGRSSWHRSWALAPPGDGDDEYVALITRGLADPLAGEFAALSTALWAPLLEHRR